MMKNLPSLWGRNPARAMSRLQHQVDRLFDQFWDEPSPDFESSDAQFSPPCDIDESDSHYILSFDVPGIRKDELRVELSNGVLHVSGERKSEKESGHGERKRTERFYGSFERAIALPENVDSEEIEASFDNGVLQVAVKKSRKQEPESHRIPVREGRLRLTQRSTQEPRQESRQDPTAQKKSAQKGSAA